MRYAAWFGLVFFAAGFAASASAQNYIYAIGSPAFSVNIPIDNGYIDVTNGNVHLEVSLARQPQRGNLQLDESLQYDSRIWQIVQVGSSLSWQPTNVQNSMDGWRFAEGNEAGTIQTNEVSYTQPGCGQTKGGVTQFQYEYAWTDSSGTAHPFDAAWTIDDYSGECEEAPTQEYNSAWATDSSDYFITLNGYNDAQPTITVYNRNGTQVYPQVEDRYGNYWSSDSNGNLIDDLGRTPVETTTSGNQITYSVLTAGGAREPYTVTTEQISVSTDFNESEVAEFSGTLTAIESITLPDNSTYSFTYDGYGEMTGMTLPTGGVVSLGYSNYQDSYKNENRWLTSYSGGHGSLTFAPAVLSQCTGSQEVGCEEQVKMTDASGNDTVYMLTLDNGAWATDITAYQGSQDSGNVLRSAVSGYDFSQQCSYGVCVGAEYINPSGTVTTLDNGLNTQVSYSYANPQTGQVTLAQYWDYYSGSSPGPAAVEEAYTYSSTGFDLTQAEVMDGYGTTKLALTTYNYNGTATATSGIVDHQSGYAAYGGNPYLASVGQWINTSNTTLTTSFTNDDTGAQLTSASPNGQTAFARDSTDTYITTATPPTPSSGISLPQSATYDASTGLPLTATDPNGAQTTYASYDWAGRPTRIDYPDGGVMTASYTATESTVSHTMTSSASATTETLLDGYGRQSRVAVANGQSTDPWYQTDYCYDANGRLQFQSYQYQGTGFGQSKVCSGAGDAYSYDALGRVTEVLHGDGTSVNYQYAGRATEVTDENGVSRITQVDGLGRITAVCEISSDSSMPDSGSPASCGLDIAGTGFLTTYSYNLDNYTTTVTQGTQSRVFETDSLGRTVSVEEPESGTTTYSYAYNGTGLVVTRQRPEENQSNSDVLTTTTTQYDALGRVVSISYSDGTPTKSFYYDQATGWGNVNLGASKGQMTFAVIGTIQDFTAGTMLAHNSMGRVSFTDQCLPGWCGNGNYDKFTYFDYDYLGNLTGTTDEVGVTTSYTYSPASEVESIASSLSNGTNPPALVSSVKNGPFGPVSYALGNGVDVVLGYDTLGRAAGEWVCSGSTQQQCSGGTQLYAYGITWKGSQLTSSCDSASGQCASYGYDQFNRLASRTVTSGTTQNYSYGYDRWGNRWTQSLTAGSGPTWSASYNTGSNRISGHYYDAAGHTTWDGTHWYTYDAEGNLTQVDSGSTAVYTYNALNERVQTDVGGTTANFLFNPAGQRESIWDAGSGAQIQGQVYWGAMPVEFYESGAAHFEHQGWLGTERLQTGYSGAVESAYLSLPFGDGYTATGTDDDPYHYAGLDADSSSATDHAQYRQYSTAQGRWLGPDSYSGSYDFSNPQTLNRYAYVANNPLALTDPSGQFAFCGLSVTQGADGAIGVSVPGVGWIVLGVCAAYGLDELFNFLFGPSFHGSLKPRPNAADPASLGESLGIPTSIPLQNPGLAAALGLPTTDCEFGPCDGGPSNFGPGIVLAGAGTVACQFVEPCGVIEDVTLGIGILGGAVGIADIVHLAKGGNQNVADTGVLEQAQQMVAGGLATDICDALQKLYDSTPPGPQRNKIKATQKAKGCRGH